ncbi:MAG: fructose-6-phosphate aldolase [Chloroflexota bacterium]
MELFVDTADIKEIEEAASWGIVSGCTTNPTLVSTQGKVDFKGHIQRICELVQGPVSAEVVSLDAENMIKEAREISTWSPHVVIKVPMTWEGIKATKALSRDGIKTNVTLVFSPNQALLAGLAGATYVSPFLGRLDDAGHDGMAVVGEIVEVYRKGNLSTKVLAASIRHPLHVVQAAKIGADVATVPFKVLKQMVKHPLTDVGIERFLADWKKVTG